jgi:hypothetical protein
MPLTTCFDGEKRQMRLLIVVQLYIDIHSKRHTSYNTVLSNWFYSLHVILCWLTVSACRGRFDTEVCAGRDVNRLVTWVAISSSALVICKRHFYSLVLVFFKIIFRINRINWIDMKSWNFRLSFWIKNTGNQQRSTRNRWNIHVL